MGQTSQYVLGREAPAVTCPVVQAHISENYAAVTQHKQYFIREMSCDTLVPFTVKKLIENWLKTVMK